MSNKFGEAMLRITDLVKDINHLQEAEVLLMEVWFNIGPYGTEKVDSETLKKLNKHFDFNDNE